MIIFLSGNFWDGVPSTDRRLASALADRHPILWVDPPVSLVTAGRRRFGGRGPVARLDKVTDNICRLRTVGPPGLTRPMLRDLSDALLQTRLRAVIRRIGCQPSTVIVASADTRFPRHIPGRRVYYVTDDWPSGASMMGLGRSRVERLLARNARDAEVVACVSPGLVDLAKSHSSATPVLLPNGCSPEMFPELESPRPADVPRHPFAILVGQVNERLDVSMLRATAERGIAIVVVGPRTDRDADVGAAIDELFDHPLVDWLGPRSPEELPSYVTNAAVGLTPYRDNDFNRSSFPLKTLEYLAAGLPVVTTDLPAARWLDTELLDIATTPEQFAERADAWIQVAARNSGSTSVVDRQHRELRRAFARRHSWRVRADQLLAVI